MPNLGAVANSWITQHPTNRAGRLVGSSSILLGLQPTAGGGGSATAGSTITVSSTATSGGAGVGAVSDTIVGIADAVTSGRNSWLSVVSEVIVVSFAVGNPLLPPPALTYPTTFTLLSYSTKLVLIEKDTTLALVPRSTTLTILA